MTRSRPCTAQEDLSTPTALLGTKSEPICSADYMYSSMLVGVAHATHSLAFHSSAMSSSVFPIDESYLVAGWLESFFWGKHEQYGTPLIVSLTARSLYRLLHPYVLHDHLRYLEAPQTWYKLIHHKFHRTTVSNLSSFTGYRF